MRVVSAVGVALGIVTAGITVAEAGDHDIYRIYYKNTGAYIVNSVEVFWEVKGGDKESRKYSNDIVADDMFCFSVDEWNASHAGDLIPDGAELHIKFHIASGDTVNCKKDNARFYFKSGSGTAYFKSAGETKTNNNCHIEDKTLSGSVASGNCR